MSSETPCLGYWAIRGLAEPIRLFLVHNNIEFNEKVYTQGDDLSREEWYADKRANDMKLDFPNIPYFLHGEVRLSESQAILHYVYELANQGERMDATHVMLTEVIKGMRQSLTSFCYGGYSDKTSALEFLEKLFESKDEVRPSPLVKIANYLSDRDWLSTTKDGPSCADFMLFDYLTCLMCMAENESTGHTFVSDAGEFKNLANFMERIGKLESMQRYLSSSEYQNRPWNNKSAKWGGKPLPLPQPFLQA